MRNMMRYATVGILACICVHGLAQRPAPTTDLATLLREIPQYADPSDPLLLAQIVERLQNAPLAEVQANLPTLMSLTECSKEEIRSLALLSLVNLGFTNQGSQSIPAIGPNPIPDIAQDGAAVELLVPYIPELLGLLDKGTPSDRALSFSVVQEISHLKPVPPALISGVIQLLSERQSTMPLPTVEDQLKQGTPPDGPSLGPQLLWILLPAGATYYHDPATHVTEGWDSPEVQEAVLQFLNREDQTPESMASSIRALALALAQNPKVNAALVKQLDSGSAEVQLVLVEQLPKIALTSDAFVVGRARVAVLKDDPSTTAEVRAAAAKILPCWTNDRHHGMCPAPDTIAYVH